MDTDPHGHDPSNAQVAAAEAPPRTWGLPDDHTYQRVEPGFVLTSWLLCLLATIVVAALGVAVISLAADTPILGETNTEIGVLTIVAAMATFIGFVVTMAVRLVSVEHDRLLNSMSVAAVHVGFALVLFLGNLLLREVAGVDIGSAFTGPWTDELGNVFTVLERSSVAAIAACLLASGMVPARGERPAGTQTAPTPTDNQL